jgi:hypothetical protein
MKPTKSRAGNGMDNGRITQLELLVDELIKECPQEARVRACMQAAGLEYTIDPVSRMESVLRALGGDKGRSGKKRRDHDQAL